jgi:PII-like signaling protein
MKTTTDSHFASRPAKRLTFLMSVHDHVRHNSLEMELLKRARKAKLAGATVFEGNEGYGASGHVHQEHFLSDDRPLAVVIIDQADKIDEFPRRGIPPPRRRARHRRRDRDPRPVRPITPVPDAQPFSRRRRGRPDRSTRSLPARSRHHRPDRIRLAVGDLRHQRHGLVPTRPADRTCPRRSSAARRQGTPRRRVLRCLHHVLDVHLRDHQASRRRSLPRSSGQRGYQRRRRPWGRGRRAGHRAGAMRSARSKSAPGRRLASRRDGSGATGGPREGGRSPSSRAERGGSTRNSDLTLFKGPTSRVRSRCAADPWRPAMDPAGARFARSNRRVG